MPDGNHREQAAGVSKADPTVLKNMLSSVSLEMPSQ